MKSRFASLLARSAVSVWRLLLLVPIPAAAQAPDISRAAPDLEAPAMLAGKPAAGKRVRQTHPNWDHTGVYHALYLPSNWEPGRRFPVLVEYAGNGPYKNRFGDVSTGLVEGSKMGYGLSAGRGYLWVCLPFLNAAGTENVRQWWGDPPEYDPGPTLEYCRHAVPWICNRYGGDSERVVLCGFSRGAIACNYIGLHDDATAKLWRAFIPYSHYDGVVEDWGYGDAGARASHLRLRRLRGRPQFVLHEHTDAQGVSLAATRRHLLSSGLDLGDSITFMETGFRNHDDAWVLRPSPPRKAVREWLDKVVGLGKGASGGEPGGGKSSLGLAPDSSE